jgi:hypothetical protein
LLHCSRSLSVSPEEILWCKKFQPYQRRQGGVGFNFLALVVKLAQLSDDADFSFEQQFSEFFLFFFG